MNSRGPTFDPVDWCSHVTMMHASSLLIQNWKRIKSVFSKSGSKVFFSKVKANQKCSLPKANQNCFPKAKADQKRFSTRWQRIKCVLRRVVIFSKRNWAGSKAFSHASASHDYTSLPTFTGLKVWPPFTVWTVLFRSVKLNNGGRTSHWFLPSKFQIWTWTSKQLKIRLKLELEPETVPIFPELFFRNCFDASRSLWHSIYLYNS